MQVSWFIVGMTTHFFKQKIDIILLAFYNGYNEIKKPWKFQVDISIGSKVMGVFCYAKFAFTSNSEYRPFLSIRKNETDK